MYLAKKFFIPKSTILNRNHNKQFANGNIFCKSFFGKRSAYKNDGEGINTAIRKFVLLVIRTYFAPYAENKITYLHYLSTNKNSHTYYT